MTKQSLQTIITTEALATEVLATVLLVLNYKIRDKKMKKLKMGQGKVVTGEWFWDREKEKELFIQKIDEGVHVLLVAQRRMGKTSLMAEVAEMLNDRCICLFVDLQKCQNGSDSIVELSLKIRPYQNLWEKTKVVFSNVLSRVTDSVETVQISELGVTLRSGLNRGNWADKGDHLLDILAAADKPVILLLDEVAIMVNNMLKDEDNNVTAEGKAQTNEFMSWLRKNSIEHQGKIRIVISGSIGLEPVLHQARLSATINNFMPLELKAWDEETAIGCIEALANENGVELEDNVPQEIVRKLGCCVPHHVQMFFTFVYDRCVKRGHMLCSKEDVDEIYKEDMLGVRGHVDLVHYEERLEKVLPKELNTMALDMLTETAVTGHLSSEAIAAFQTEHSFGGRDIVEVQKEILWVLEHDGYLRSGPEGYVFASKYLRDWWKNRYRRFFTPVLKRGS